MIEDARVLRAEFVPHELEHRDVVEIISTN